MDRQDIKQLVEDGKRPEKGIPCGFWMHFPSECSVGDASIAIHNNYYYETHVQLLKIMNEHPYHIDFAVEKPEDWRRIKKARLQDTDYVNFLDEIRRIRACHKESYILATIHGVLVSACHATEGMGKFPNLNNMVTRHLKEDPESVCMGLSEIAATLEDLSIACIEAGADGIYYAALGAEESRFTEEFYCKYVKPIEVRMLGNVMNKGDVFLHICKDYPRITMFADYPCHVVNWTAHCCNTTLEEALDLFKDKRIMCGFDNKPGSPLYVEPMADIQSEIMKLAAQVGRDRLLIGADCTLPGSTDKARIREISDFCERI